MHSEIQRQLQALERHEEMRILYACESGSQAWGFASPVDSDDGVHFIYVRPVTWYLSIDSGRDVIELPITGGLDINCWDLLEALGLFRRSNPPLIEWLQSPIVYRDIDGFRDSLRTYIGMYFSLTSCMYRYLSMAKHNFKTHLQQDNVQLKKYFYVLRSVLACRWIESEGTMPPIEFVKLLQAQVLSGRLRLRSLVFWNVNHKRPKWVKGYVF
jgi:predicted nucleotidyltransferase